MWRQHQHIFFVSSDTGWFLFQWWTLEVQVYIYIYIYTRTHFCCSASECTFNYGGEDRPLDVHHSWLRALLGPLALESKSIHLASAVGLSRPHLSRVIGVYLPRSCRWRAPWCGGFQYPFNREIMWWTTNIGSIRSIHQWDVCDSFEVHKEKLMENKQKKKK